MATGPLSPRDAGRLARACLENAEALLSDAELLLNAGRPASAATWALLALEEFGKHIMACSATTLVDADGEGWRAFWRRWRTHPPKLTLGIEHLIDIVVGTLPDEHPDDVWVQAYRELEVKVKDANHWKQDGIYIDWRDGDVVSPASSFDGESAGRLVNSVGVVVQSGIEMWEGVDLADALERSATEMRTFKEDTMAALQDDDPEQFFRVFEQFVRRHAPAGVDIDEVLGQL